MQSRYLSAGCPAVGGSRRKPGNIPAGKRTAVCSALSSCMRSTLATSHQASASRDIIRDVYAQAIPYASGSAWRPHYRYLGAQLFKAVDIGQRYSWSAQISPQIATFCPFHAAQPFTDGKCIQQCSVGCSLIPSPCINNGHIDVLRIRKWVAPLAECRITTISTFMERILFTVSISVSPFETEEPDAREIHHICAQPLFSQLKTRSAYGLSSQKIK